MDSRSYGCRNLKVIKKLYNFDKFKFLIKLFSFFRPLFLHFLMLLFALFQFVLTANNSTSKTDAATGSSPDTQPAACISGNSVGYLTIKMPNISR